MTFCTVRQPSASALSTAALSSTAWPPRQPPSAVMTSVAPRVLDAVLHGVGGESAEYHRMDGPDAGAGLHGDHGLGYERQVDDDPVAAANAQRLQRVREAAHLAVQFGVGEPADIARLALENNRSLAAVSGEMHIEAIVRNVQFAVGEPAVIRCVGVIQGHRERPMPVDFGHGQIRPEADVVVRSPGVHIVQCAGIEIGVPAEPRGGWKYPVFLQHGLNVCLSHRLPRL